MTREQLALALAVVIATLYAGALVFDALNTAYTVPKELHGLMGLAGAWVFGIGVARANGKSNGH